MANDITTRQPGAFSLIPTSMTEAIELANFMATARTLPACLQNSAGDCLMVIEQAMRWRMSPFAVAQCTSSIKGKLMYEGKLVAAAVEGSGAIQGQLDYAFSGQGDDRTITVSAVRTGEKTARTVEVKLKDARTANEFWNRQPDQQLVYHGVRVWARRWTPSVILGVYSPEEFGPGSGAAPDRWDGPTIEGAPEPTPPPPPSSPPPPPTDRREQINREVPIDRFNQPKGETKTETKTNGSPTNGKRLGAWDRWFGSYEAAMVACKTQEEWHALHGRQTVIDALAKVPNEYHARLDRVRLEHSRRLFPEVKAGG